MPRSDRDLRVSLHQFREGPLLSYLDVPGLGIARASFYRWLLPKTLTSTRQRHVTLADHVTRVYTREKGKAGRDQIAFLLRNEGVKIADGTVGSIMRELGLRAARMTA